MALRDPFDFETPIEPGALLRHPEDQLVFRTEVPFEADLVAGALQQAGVPFYRRAVSRDGVLPSGFDERGGPGDTVFLMAPASAADRARRIVEEVPLGGPEEAADVVPHPNPAARRRRKMVAFYLVAGAVLWIVVSLVVILQALLS